MAHYTDVKLIIDGTVVGTSPQADVGLPDQHKLIVMNVTWTSPNPRAFLDYLQQNCTVKAKGPDDKVQSFNMKISGITGDSRVHLD